MCPEAVEYQKDSKEWPKCAIKDPIEAQNTKNKAPGEGTLWGFEKYFWWS
jgi:hypothetical protein